MTCVCGGGCAGVGVYVCTSTIVLPTDALLCKNTNCTEHHDDIDIFYDSFIAGLKSSANLCIPSSNVSNKAYVVPGWNEYVKEHHLHAKNALLWWNFNRSKHVQYMVT